MTRHRLTRAGLLLVSARALPRDLVSDRPDLVAARLEHRLVRAPEVVTAAVARLYAEAATHPNSPQVTSAHWPGAPRRSSLEPADDSLRHLTLGR